MEAKTKVYRAVNFHDVGDVRYLILESENPIVVKFLTMPENPYPVFGFTQLDFVGYLEDESYLKGEIR